MGCNCHNTIRQDFERIKKLAILTAITNEEDIQIYSWTERGIGRLYDFEPKGFTERGKGLVKVIKFRDHKRKNILPDSKDVSRDSSKAKKTKRESKSTRGNSNSERRVAKSNESVRGSKPGDSSKKVAGNN
jgi:hypothetical protein